VADVDFHEQTVLIFTALFHDAAKPLTSEVDPETGRITSPKHAVKGEHLARGVLRDLGCDLATREQIARLVRYHGRPAFLLERTSRLTKSSGCHGWSTIGFCTCLPWPTPVVGTPIP
jgi:hypothetical protein